MGRKTWQSFPDKYRPLPGRTNIVITRQENWGETPEAEGAVVVNSLDDALLESQFVATAARWSGSSAAAKIFAPVHRPRQRRGGHHHRCGRPTATRMLPELGDDWRPAVRCPPDGWLTAANGTRYRFTQWAGRRAEMLKKPETLFVLGYMLLPLLALLSAIVGLTMILGGNKIAGAIVLVVVTQVFTFGAVFARCRWSKDTAAAGQTDTGRRRGESGQ